MHRSFFNVPIPTLIKAIQNDQLTGFPCMAVKNVKKYLAPSPARTKGCMKRLQTGIRSTTKRKEQREKIQEEPLVENKDTTEINFTVPAEGCVIPEEEHIYNCVCFVALANKNK